MSNLQDAAENAISEALNTPIPKDLDQSIDPAKGWINQLQTPNPTPVEQPPSSTVATQAHEQFVQLVHNASAEGRKHITDARNLLDDLLRATNDRGRQIVEDATKFIADVETTIKAKDAIMAPFADLLKELKVTAKTIDNG